ncbi:MAG: sugar phosphate isomerase/epimerase [Chloroflexota bacterium]|nr:sugar phosphate isomerase/epimerase [Chloroflexota bacterium]
MEGIQVGCGQITWSRSTPEEQVLAEIAQAGYEGAPASPRAGRSAEETVELYARHGLKPVPGYLGAAFWQEDQREQILEQARQLAFFMRQVGCTELYVAAGGFDYVTASGRTRSQLAGHVSPQDALSADEYEQFAQVLNEVGKITLAEGVRSCFHNHVGSVIETREEINQLFSLVDRDLVFQGPDIGHLAWGGADVVQFCRDYADSIKAMHLKDINPNVMQEGREKGWDYRSFSDHGIFAELGEGFVDFPAIFDILGDAGFQGWVIVETDVTQKPTALESAVISRSYLKSIGI